MLPTQKGGGELFLKNIWGLFFHWSLFAWSHVAWSLFTWVLFSWSLLAGQPLCSLAFPKSLFFSLKSVVPVLQSRVHQSLYLVCCPYSCRILHIQSLSLQLCLQLYGSSSAICAVYLFPKAFHNIKFSMGPDMHDIHRPAGCQSTQSVQAAS